jgi:hypothetical protein
VEGGRETLFKDKTKQNTSPYPNRRKWQPLPITDLTRAHLMQTVLMHHHSNHPLLLSQWRWKPVVTVFLVSGFFWCPKSKKHISS